MNTLDHYEYTMQQRNLKRKLNIAPNKERIWNVAATCSSRVEFKKSYSVEYRTAQQLGILHAVTRHMGSENIIWTDSKDVEEVVHFEKPLKAGGWGIV